MQQIRPLLITVWAYSVGMAKKSSSLRILLYQELQPARRTSFWCQSGLVLQAVA